jgi:hypothetical protein
MGLAWGLMIWPTLEVAGTIGAWPIFVFAAWLALIPLLAAASVRFLFASILLSQRKKFPLRPTPFLRWAHSAGLLRVTGGAYQFRHDTYRAWLTQHPALAQVTQEP